MTAAARDGPGAWPIATGTNVAIGLAAIVANLGCLWWASHAAAWWQVLAAAVLFSYTNNTVFSLQHEAVHGLFARDRRLNDAAGIVLAAWFPTIFAVQRISHLGHHRRNRSDAELYDYVLPQRSRWLKTYWLYCLLTGFYWAIIPVAMALYLLWPPAFRARWFLQGPARWWGFESFVADIGRAPVATLWWQGAFTLALQATVVLALDLGVWGWLACYWAFGLNWSSVQYSDHAYSPRHVTEGAWNLRFWPVARWMFLNYNFHLVHHRRPDIPWPLLPGQVRAGDPRPSFWGIYLKLWRGAQPAPTGPGSEWIGPAAEGPPAGSPQDGAGARRAPAAAIVEGRATS